jgi:hypothetical protein
MSLILFPSCSISWADTNAYAWPSSRPVDSTYRSVLYTFFDCIVVERAYWFWSLL